MRANDECDSCDGYDMIYEMLHEITNDECFMFYARCLKREAYVIYDISTA